MVSILQKAVSIWISLFERCSCALLCFCLVSSSCVILDFNLKAGVLTMSRSLRGSGASARIRRLALLSMGKVTYPPLLELARRVCSLTTCLVVLIVFSSYRVVTLGQLNFISPRYTPEQLRSTNLGISKPPFLIELI